MSDPNPYASLADDFFVNLDLETVCELPRSRETVLHFCEAVQKQFPEMTAFFNRETGEYVLEGDRESGQYRWMELHPRRLSAGAFNPADLETAYSLHRWLLDRSTYFLGVSGLDVDCLNVSFGFNLDYRGNRDAIVAEALLGGSPLAALADAAQQIVECQPGLIIALDDECYKQSRLIVETHNSSYHIRTGQYEDEPISVHLTMRRYPQPGEVMDTKEVFAQLCRDCDEMTGRLVVPLIVRPLAEAISAGE